MGMIVSWVGTQLLSVVLPSLATVIAGFLLGLLRKQLQKAGIELTEQQADQVKRIVTDAVKATEEAARRGDVTTSDEKKAMATREVVAKLPDLAPGDVAHAIDAVLPDVRVAAQPPVVINASRPSR